jgi:hypothetical protein
MYGLAVAVLFGSTLAWAKFTQSWRVYRSLWLVAAGIMLLIGLAL